MKSKTYDIIAKILSYQEGRGEISLQKLVFLVYLCDWKYSIEHGKQITDIKWRFIDSEFSKKIISAFEEGRVSKNIYDFKSKYTTLSEKEKSVIDFIGAKSKKLKTNDFIRLVYSTYPMIRMEKNKDLDLPVLAEDYKANYDYV